MSHAFQVRPERPADLAAIRMVNRDAFGRADEADLVDALRANGHVVVSLAADSRDEVIGHILFSHLPIRTPAQDMAAAALAPMAVLPGWQGRGVGSALVRIGVEHCRRAGFDAVVVLGHPDFYPRFGFSAHMAEPLQAPFAGPAFMALELVPGALRDGGVVRYPDEFFALP